MSRWLKALALVGAPLAIAGVATAALASSASPHVWYVDGIHGSDKNDCASQQHACKTIAHAVSLAAAGDSIVVGPAVYRDNMVIDQSLTIVGSGASTTIIDGGGIITPTPDAVVTLSGLTLRNGGGVGDGGAIYNCMTDLTIVNSVITNNFATSGMGSLGYGGAIYNCPGSTLTVINSTFSGNRALAGGAICNGGVLTILDSTFDQNVARAQKGGAIFNYGNLMVANSTFTGNRVLRGRGGGIHNGELIGQKGNATISNSTVSGNTAASGKGGGIFSLKGAVTTVQNSIVSGNSGGNCSGLIASQGYNLSSDNTCSFKGPGDLNSVDPRLGPLRDNGGPTETMALRPGSPAIDAGNPSGCFDGQGDGLITDQRGEPRPDSEDRRGCDIGAYERQGD